MVNTSKSSLKKTSYKYTYKSSPDGKTKKLPIFETIKGKYIVLVDGKKKYVNNPKKIVGGTDEPPIEVQFDSLVTILENIPKYFASNYIIFTNGTHGGAPNLTISMNNFINHKWSNKSQFVHFSNLNKNKEALKLITYFFIMFFSLYVMWNYEIIFNYFNPDYVNRVPRLKDVYDNIQHLITSVPDDKLPMAIGESFNVKNPFNRFQIESFFNEANKMHSNIEENEFNFIILLNLFLVIMSIYNIYNVYIKNLRYKQKKLNANELNEMAKKLLNRQQEQTVQGTNALQKDRNTVTTSNANKLPNKKVLKKLFDLYVDNDFVDIQSFENLATKVDEELAVFLQEKYQYIIQPNSGIAMIKREDSVVTHPNQKGKLESMSRLLHAMHNAQKTHLLSIHDPRHMMTNASLQDDQALRTFKETYKEVTGKVITYIVDETTGFITYKITEHRQPLPQIQGGGKRKTKLKDSKKKTSKKLSVK